VFVRVVRFTDVTAERVESLVGRIDETGPPPGVPIKKLQLVFDDRGPLTDLLAAMIAAGGVERLPARTPWPMHAALAGLHEEAGRLGLRAAIAVELTFEPCPDTGRAAKGADVALQDLVTSGLLREVGELRDARLEVDPVQLAQHRRALMARAPGVVAMLQRAGSRWAALASTVAKYAVSDAPSSGEIVASGAV
jgi:hypothetical protein